MKGPFGWGTGSCAFQHSWRRWHGSCSGFGSWKTVPTVPVSVKGQKEPQSQRIARSAPKKYLNNSRALPSKTRAFEANHARKFTRKFGKIFVAKVLWGTFSVSGSVPGIATPPDPLPARFLRHPCDLFRHLQSCPGAQAGKCPAECFLTAFGHPVPQRELFECFPLGP